MECTDIGEQLMDVASGMVATPEFESHLRACAACAQRLEEMRRTMALLDEWVAPEPSPYFDARLRARLREEAARPHGLLAWLRRPALAAAMAALLVAGATLLRTATEHNPKNVQIVEVNPGTPVGDLERLDKDHDLLANFDALDDLVDQQQPDSQNETP